MWLWEAVTGWMTVVVLHAVLCRLPIKANIVAKFLMAGIPLGLLLAYRQLDHTGLSVKSMAGLTLYAFICELYIFIFASVPASISISLLRTLHKKVMTQDEINQCLESRALFEWRLSGLEREGLLEKTSSVCRVTVKGKRLAGFFRALQKFFGHSRAPELAPRSSRF